MRRFYRQMLLVLPAVVAIAALAAWSPSAHAAPASARVVHAGPDLGLDPAFLPDPEPITFPTSSDPTSSGPSWAFT